MGWIEKYLEWTIDTEPKDSFHLWTAISLVAGALQKRVYISVGGSRRYANMYIILVGPSGKSRKTTAIEYGERLLRQTSAIICPDAISGWQAFSHMMNQDWVIQEENIPGLGMVKHRSVTAFAKELRVFLRDDTDFVAMLTSLFDTDDVWEYYSIKHELQRVNWAFFNMLGATNREYLRTMLPSEAIGGGYTSRVIFIVEENKRGSRPSPKMDSGLQEDLIDELMTITGLAGPAQETTEFMKTFGKWYIGQDKETSNGHPPVPGENFSSYCSRRGLHVKKLSLISAVSRTGGLRIEEEDFDWALGVLESAEQRMPMAFAGFGKAQYAGLTFQVLQILEAKHRVTQAEVMRMLAYDLDAEGMESIAETLRKQGVIKVTRPKGKKEVVYELRD